jgi:hypothetical protein
MGARTPQEVVAQDADESEEILWQGGDFYAI